MTSMKKLAATVGAVVMLTALPAAGAQTQYAMAAPPEPVAERADELRAEAESLFSQPKRWEKAMRLMRESAELRTADDPEAFTCLMYAGQLGVAVGEYDAAYAALHAAAEHALARGALRDAASAYIDAAHAARLKQDVAAAKEMIERASLLATSPLLSASDRASLQYRLRA